ncbi:MAG TPA: CHAT domain-containing tetratricopeptide repeat protein [Candidatus Polarisedimenticolia bacterium]|jgi:CHAT domain-containing protein/tetratricopeptide (TPR) repeat protein|nr:CHAT domain-containing tetratricopeptide repeat protein [Candidatus Polarisedimenticolia bacterium]
MPAEEASVAGLPGVYDLVDQGRYADAESHGRLILARAEAESGPDSLAVADALMALVTAVLPAGKASEPGTLTWAQRAHAIQTSHLNDSDPALAASLQTLGDVYFMRGDYASSRAALERALALREQAHVQDDQRTVKLLTGLANTNAETGDYTKARTFYERGLAVLERLTTNKPSFVVGFLSNYGTILHDLGDLENARAIFERGLDRAREGLGKDHPLYALVLDNLGGVLQELGDLAAARQAFERALAIREAKLGPDRPPVAVSLSNLGGLLLDVGEAAAAVPLFERALRIREAALGPEHPLIAITLTGLARSLIELDQPEKARPLLERALEIRKNRLGTEHPFFARSLIYLANLDYRTGNEERALDGALRAEEILRAHIARTAHYLSDRQALDYKAMQRSGLDVAFAAGLGGGDGHGTAPRARRAWEALIRSRAVILDEVAARHRFLLDAAEPSLSPWVHAWDDARARFAALVATGPGAGTAGEYRDLLRRARAATDRAERDVAVRSAAARRDLQARSARLEDIRRALPPSTALVAYARFERPRQGHHAAETRYVAFVLPPGRGGIAMATLGSSGVIDDLVRRFRGEVGAPPKSVASLATCRQVGEKLRRLVWDPLAGKICGARAVLLVPDGDLHLLNFATLPVGQDGYLLETGPVLHYLSAERDVLALSAGDRNLAGIARPGGLLALGGLDFGDRPVAETSVASRAGIRLSDCAGLGAPTFLPLPGSKAEVEEIAALWVAHESLDPPGSPSRGVALVLTGRQGGESEFKKRAAGRRVIHLATHGFSLDDVCPTLPATHGDKVAGGPEASGSAFPVFGLALADVNRSAIARHAEAEDGILTSDEIAALDLRGVEWVVLSGCQTGVGPALRGEGVLGLRRAFQVAGARTLVMSLWAVGDHDAREWILELYRARLAGGTTAEATRAASLRVLENRRRAGALAHPYFWGAFVAAGDWR